MLEAAVSQLLERLLGDYVEGFQTGNVKLSVFSTTSGIGETKKKKKKKIHFFNKSKINDSNLFVYIIHL